MLSRVNAARSMRRARRRALFRSTAPTRDNRCDVAGNGGEERTPVDQGQPMTGVQVPGEVGTLQLIHTPSQAVSQQTPSAPHTPLAHSSVVPQVVPGVFLRWQAPVPSQ